MTILYNVFEKIMNGCYFLCRNYGLAIILFTFISKIVLLPVSVWVHKNSIKMVKMQPDINFLKAQYFGDKDSIAEEQSKLYKREKYNPAASIIPLAVQIVLLLGVVYAIRAGIDNPQISMDFCGINLSLIPSEMGVVLLYSPIVAGLSAWILCVAQNSRNVLQAEQSMWNKFGTMAFSVGLSLYLGWFVPVGVALYWVCSNLMAVLQLLILNVVINPKKYIDYERLSESKKALETLGSVGSEKNRKTTLIERRREKQDYKRFFSVVNKHLVFYSEGSGFYKYFKGYIEYLLEYTNLQIHYITSDPEDAVFKLAEKQERIHAYYIGEKKLITLMMKMDADVVLMTMPDLENYHIKRSYVRKDIEYIYIPHGMDSLNLTMRTGAMDHYDTIFCVGKHQSEEVRKTEAVYGLPEKTLIDCGYPLLDDMRADFCRMERKEDDKLKILIAPSWQKDNIVDNCLEEILDQLKGQDYQITVRPHPQHVRHQKEKMEGLKQQYQNDSDIVIQTDFSSNSTVFEADLMITDWSGIAYEYAYTTQRPVLFINTPMKIMNPEYQKIDTIPLNIWLRDEIGHSLELSELSKVQDTVKELILRRDEYYNKIGAFVEEYVYNVGNSAEIGAKYIINRIQEKIQTRKENRE
ncbi:MAG: membrane protein insertase YidC [Lachnospiraceae bacterium]|nr:membrane protein insertase YidC [Lachnospiraceae bacterium]